MDQLNILEAEQQLHRNEQVIKTEEDGMNPEWVIEVESQHVQTAVEETTQNKDTAEFVMHQQSIINQSEIPINSYNQNQLEQTNIQTNFIQKQGQSAVISHQDRVELIQNQNQVRSAEEEEEVLPQIYQQQERVVVTAQQLPVGFVPVQEVIVLKQFVPEVFMNQMMPEAAMNQLMPRVEIDQSLKVKQQVVLGDQQTRRKEQLVLQRAQIQIKQAEILHFTQRQNSQNRSFEQRLIEEEVIFQPTSSKPTSNNQVQQLSIILESQVYYSSFFQWKKGIAVIENQTIKIPQKSLPLMQLTKIKILKETGVHDSKKIKLSYYTNNIFFSVQPNQTIFNLPLHYFWFAKIVNEKMRLKGCDLKSPYVPQRTFTNVNIQNAYIDGIIYKQSQYRKNWELRYIAITPQGLFSYKDQKGGETFSIKKDTTNQIWTRFDIHERMLIIKVHHSGRKTEFGIPITDYCLDSGANWLLAFYKLIFQQ